MKKSRFVAHALALAAFVGAAGTLRPPADPRRR